MSLEIMQNKLDSLLNTNRSHVLDVVEKIEYDAQHVSDMIVPFGPMSKLRFQNNGSFNAIIDNEKYTMHKNAVDQLSTQFGIPTRYVSDLMGEDWGRDLVQQMFTEHNDHSTRNRMLIRAVDSEVRGILSDKYRRLDSRDIYGAFINKAKASGAEFIEAYYTPVKSYLTVIFPKVYKIATDNNGDVYTSFGARIRNSDFGQSTLSISAFQYSVICRNGMVGESSLSVKHLGRRLTQDLQLSQRTYELDTKTMASAVKDITSNVLSEDAILDMATKMKDASRQEINMDTAVKKLDRVHKGEQQSILKILANGDPERGVQGKPTKWKLSQAITAHANDVGGVRKQELDEIAGKLLKL